MTILALLLTLTNSLAAPPLKTWPLLGDQAYPESISYRESTGSFFVSDSGDGSVQEVLPSGAARYYLPAGADGRKEAYGIKVDEAHNRLWLVDGQSLFVYHLNSALLEKKISRQELGAVSDSFLNDLVVDSSGNAYVTDSRDAHLLLVDGATLGARLRPLPGIPFGNQNANRYNLNGIVIDEAAGALISVKTNDGSLWKIPLAEAQAPQALALSEPVTFGDGLAWGPGHTLLVMRNFANKVSRVGLQPVAGTLPVSDLGFGGLATPTSGVFLPDSGQVVVLNSQFANDPPLLPFSLAIYALPPTQN